MTEKTFFRKICLERRKDIQIQKVNDLVVARVRKFFSQNHFQSVGFYYPIQGEIDLRSVLDELQTESKIITLALPRIENHQFSFREWSIKEALCRDETGVPAPQSDKRLFPQCLLIPCVAIDRQGYRLGYGGGWYDRLLSQTHFDLTVGVVCRECVFDKLPHEPHDQRLDGYISEDGFTLVRPSSSKF